MIRRLAVLVGALALVAAACGNDAEEVPLVEDDEEEAPAAPEPDDEAGDEAPEGDEAGDEPGDAAQGAAVQVADTELGAVLVDSSQMTLYLFTADSEGTSTCTGGCADAWPPLVVDAEPTAGDGVDAALLGTITRDDGSTQVTYGGMPLYLYTGDQAPGDTSGQRVGGVWFAVAPDGTPADG